MKTPHKIWGNLVAALKTSERSASEEQGESLVLEQQLQGIVRKILCANEAERTNMSQVLQHEIAQALLGIKIKLPPSKAKRRPTNSPSPRKPLPPIGW